VFDRFYVCIQKINGENNVVENISLDTAYRLALLYRERFQLHSPIHLLGCIGKIGQTTGLVHFGRWIYPFVIIVVSRY